MKNKQRLVVKHSWVFVNYTERYSKRYLCIFQEQEITSSSSRCKYNLERSSTEQTGGLEEIAEIAR